MQLRQLQFWVQECLLLPEYLQNLLEKTDFQRLIGILSIGVNRRGLADALGACKFGKMVACCDVDIATFGPFQKS